MGVQAFLRFVGDRLGQSFLGFGAPVFHRIHIRVATRIGTVAGFAGSAEVNYVVHPTIMTVRVRTSIWHKHPSEGNSLAHI